MGIANKSHAIFLRSEHILNLITNHLPSLMKRL
jgi:hypothetical protein